MQIHNWQRKQNQTTLRWNTLAEQCHMFVCPPVSHCDLCVFHHQAAQQWQCGTNTSAAQALPARGPQWVSSAAWCRLLLPAWGLSEHPPAAGQPPRRHFVRLHPHWQRLGHHTLWNLSQFLSLFPEGTSSPTGRGKRSEVILIEDKQLVGRSDDIRAN